MRRPGYMKGQLKGISRVDKSFAIRNSVGRQSWNNYLSGRGRTLQKPYVPGTHLENELVEEVADEREDKRQHRQHSEVKDDGRALHFPVRPPRPCHILPGHGHFHFCITYLHHTPGPAPNFLQRPQLDPHFTHSPCELFHFLDPGVCAMASGERPPNLPNHMPMLCNSADPSVDIFNVAIIARTLPFSQLRRRQASNAVWLHAGGCTGNSGKYESMH